MPKTKNEKRNAMKILSVKNGSGAKRNRRFTYANNGGKGI
jgi:hypothetical protein